MATRRRKRRGTRRASARRNPVNPVNPVRRRRRRRNPVNPARRRRVYARGHRRNPVNPVRRRRRYGRRRHRNPVSGLFSRAVPLVLGSAAIGMAAPFTAQLVGRFAPQLLGTPIGAAATTFGTGWGLSAIAGMFGFTRKWKDDILLAGAILAGGQLFSAYVAPMIRLGGQRGNGMGRRYPRQGMSGIGVMTSIPPGMAALPPVANQQGMQGIGVMTAIPPGMPR